MPICSITESGEAVGDGGLGGRSAEWSVLEVEGFMIGI